MQGRTQVFGHCLLELARERIAHEDLLFGRHARRELQIVQPFALGVETQSVIPLDLRVGLEGDRNGRELEAGDLLRRERVRGDSGAGHEQPCAQRGQAQMADPPTSMFCKIRRAPNRRSLPHLHHRHPHEPLFMAHNAQ